MGQEEYRGRTIALDVGDPSKDTRNVLFSHQDVRLFKSHAEEIFRQAQAEPALDLSIFYDRSNRVFRNWVQHPFGMAEMRVYLTPAGKAERIEIEYGVKPAAQGNYRHVNQAIALRGMATELGIPVEVEEKDVRSLEVGLPYARN